MSEMNPKQLIPRLLSGKNQLSRWEKDEIFEKVMSEVKPPRRWPRRVVPILALVSVAAIILIPMALEDRAQEAMRGEFAARGQGSATGAFSASCTNNHETCQPGDTLIFDLSVSSGYQYFAAFAKRADGAVIWYFPESPADTSVDLLQRLQAGVLDRGVLLGTDHTAGLYQLYGIFSAEPLSRTEIKERFKIDAVDIGPGTAVITEELRIQ